MGLGYLPRRVEAIQRRHFSLGFTSRLGLVREVFAGLPDAKGTGSLEALELLASAMLVCVVSIENLEPRSWASDIGRELVSGDDFLNVLAADDSIQILVFDENVLSVQESGAPLSSCPSA